MSDFRQVIRDENGEWREVDPLPDEPSAEEIESRKRAEIAALRAQLASAEEATQRRYDEGFAAGYAQSSDDAVAILKV